MPQKNLSRFSERDNSAIEPPIWAGMLANHVRTRGFSTAILDCEAERLDWESSAKTISDFDAKVICFVVYGQQPSASSQNMTGAVGIANLETISQYSYSFCWWTRCCSTRRSITRRLCRYCFTLMKAYMQFQTYFQQIFL